MRAERLGSYSMVATRPGIPYFSRLKSIRRSICLWPPPWWRMVRSPWLRRPPVRCLTARSGLCGFAVVRASLTCGVLERRVGVVGLYVLIAMVVCPGKPAPKLKPRSPVSPEPIPNFGAPIIFPVDLPAFSCSLIHIFTRSLLLQVAHILGQLLAGLQPDISLLPIRLEAGELAAAAFLANHIGGANRGDLHLEECLDRLLDLGLGGVGRHVEDQRTFGLLDAQPLFGNQRAANHCIESRHYAASVCAAILRFDAFFSSISVICSMAAVEKMARS